MQIIVATWTALRKLPERAWKGCELIQHYCLEHLNQLIMAFTDCPKPHPLLVIEPWMTKKEYENQFENLNETDWDTANLDNYFSTIEARISLTSEAELYLIPRWMRLVVLFRETDKRADNIFSDIEAGLLATDSGAEILQLMSTPQQCALVNLFRCLDKSAYLPSKSNSARELEKRIKSISA